MADVKWIKISTGIFDDEKFDAIRTMPDGNDIQLVWFKLLCLAGKCNEGGLLMITRELPYTDEMLASHFRMDIGVVQRALGVFQQLEMIDVIENAYMVSNWSKYQNEDRLEEMRRKDRERKREQKKALETAKDDTDKNSTEIPRKIPRNCSISLSSKSYNSVSYSFDKNNNLKNYEYLIGNSIYKDSSYILERPELDLAIRDWMTYKDEKSGKDNHYGSKMSLSKLLTVIVNNDRKYGTSAVAKVIDLSISNQWKGICWDKIGSSEGNGKELKGADAFMALALGDL